MASTTPVTFDGFFTTDVYKNTTTRSLTRFFCVGLQETLRLGEWTTHNVYVNDVDRTALSEDHEHGHGQGHGPLVAPPRKELYRAVDRALTELRVSAAAAADAMFARDGADGLPGRPHAVGGRWVAPRNGRDPRVVFYVARNNTMDSTGRWRMFMCADVGTRELWSELCL